MSDLYPFQEKAVAFHLKSRYSLNCSEMGTGKTRMALGAALRAGEPILVFGPAFLKENWKAELSALRSNLPMEFVAYTQLHKFKPSDFKGFNFWIADEVHYLKNPKAQRTAAFYSHLKARVPRYFVGLTGTPVRNRVPDFWTLLAFCGVDPEAPNGVRLRDRFPGYHGFADYFCHFDTMTIQRRPVKRYKGLREDRVDELKDLLRGKFIRFTVEQVLKDLPALVRKSVNFKLKPTPGLEEAFKEYLEGRKADPRAKALSALTKAPQTAAYVSGILEEGQGPVLVFTDHRESASVLSKAFGGAPAITGETPPSARAEAVSRFQAGKTPVLVATIGSLSVGVTLTAARHLVFNDLSWTPADNLQAEKRIHRIGQSLPCFIHFMEATETDALIRRTLYEKMEAINALV